MLNVREFSATNLRPNLLFGQQKGEHGVPQNNLISVTQQVLAYRHSIYKRAVPAAEIANEVFPTRVLDYAVLAGQHRVTDADLGGRAPADAHGRVPPGMCGVAC